MKKITFVLIIIALSIFMSAAVVSAGGHGWKRFHGTYEMIANGTCLHSSLGYTDMVNPPIIPIAGSVVYVGTTMAQATWTFKSNGEGAFSFINYVTILPGDPVSFRWARFVSFRWAAQAAQMLDGRGPSHRRHLFPPAC